MSKRCKHRRSRESVSLLIYADNASSIANAITKRWCFDCASYIPLGPSNDADERVQIEIRAAEIAGTLKVTDVPSLNGCESHGWEAHANGMKPVLCVHKDFNAGHLAREIVTHEDHHE